VWFLVILVIGILAKCLNSVLNRATVYFSPEPVGNEEFEKYQFPSQSSGAGSSGTDAEAVESNPTKSE